MRCPWCKKIDIPISLLKRHVKWCIDSPRPRGRTEKKRREEKTEIEKILRS
jgi:hypothetical protein